MFPMKTPENLWFLTDSWGYKLRTWVIKLEHWSLAIGSLTHFPILPGSEHCKRQTLAECHTNIHVTYLSKPFLSLKTDQKSVT